MIRIRSTRKEGIWRCGVHHGPEPVDYPDDRFTAEELRRLKAEPFLVVEEIPEERPAEPAPAAVLRSPPQASAEEEEKPAKKAGKGKK